MTVYRGWPSSFMRGTAVIYARIRYKLRLELELRDAISVYKKIRLVGALSLGKVEKNPQLRLQKLFIEQLACLLMSRMLSLLNHGKMNLATLTD